MKLPKRTAAAGWMSLMMLCLTAPAAAAERLYRNEEYGIATRFPPGLRVCEAMSGGYHPVGFHAWIGRRTDCDAARPSSVSALNVTAIYNAAFFTTMTLPGCRNGEAPHGRRADLRGLAFPGLRSIRCMIRRQDGSLEILVKAQGGRWGGHHTGPDSRAPLIYYSALLITRPERLRRDLALFRSLLVNTRITEVVHN